MQPQILDTQLNPSVILDGYRYNKLANSSKFFRMGKHEIQRQIHFKKSKFFAWR